MPFRGRKSIPIIPFILKYNFAVSAGKRNGVQTSGSWTMGLLGVATYNTRDGRYRVNTPGWGWWESSTRAQRRKRGAERRAASTRRPATAPPGSRAAADPDAGAFARYFRALRQEGTDPATIAQAARGYGRCPDCGHRVPASRGGEAACRACLRKAQRARERADAAAADAVRVQQQAGAPVKAPRSRYADRGRATANQPHERPPAGQAQVLGDIAPDDDESLDQFYARARRELAVYDEETRGGQCGANTQDGTPCKNGAGCAIPSHRRVKA